MRTSWMIGLVVTLCVLAGVGSAGADSTASYLDGSLSDAFNLGGGTYAFVFYNDLNPPDIFVHAVNAFTNLLFVSLPTATGVVNGYAFFLSFEGFNQGFRQYGVYACVSFSNQVCNVNGFRRGTFFL